MDQNNKKNDKSEMGVMITIFVIILAFIFGLKPLYKLFSNMTPKLNNTPIENKEEQPKEEYKILKPVGQNNIICKKNIDEIEGTKKITITLYYNEKLSSIREDVIYSSITEEYTNYILSEQNKFKQRKTLNNNLGYSIEYQLDGTSYLKMSSVYLLDTIELSDINLGEDDILELEGNNTMTIQEAQLLYMNKNYICEG